MFDTTLFKLASAETLRLEREKELVEAKERWKAEAIQYIEEVDRAKIIDGYTPLKNPNTYVKGLMKFNIDDINSVLTSRELKRPCLCTLKALDIAMKEMVRKDFHTQVVADAASYLFEKGLKSAQELLFLREEATTSRRELKRFQQHVKREQSIEKYTWGCTWSTKHEPGANALHILAMEREELLIKIPYIYSKLLDIVMKVKKD